MKTCILGAIDQQRAKRGQGSATSTRSYHILTFNVKETAVYDNHLLRVFLHMPVFADYVLEDSLPPRHSERMS